MMNPANPNFADEVAASFAQQSIMNLIGARLTLVEPGVVEITLPYRNDLTQQNGYLHAGIVTTIADSACGYAAFTLMPAGSAVLSVEFKVNLLRPAKGETFVSRAEVIKAWKDSDSRARRRFCDHGKHPHANRHNAGNDDPRVLDWSASVLACIQWV